MGNDKKLNLDLIDFNTDYYAVLGLKKGDLPEGKTTLEKKEITKILEKSYKGAARRSHPDVPGGSEETFKLVVRAYGILADEILRKYWESKGDYRPILAGEGGIDSTSVDWDSLGEYRKGTLQDNLLHSLFLQIAAKKQELGIVPAFIAKDIYDNYEADFALPDEEVKLAISLVSDENDVLRLTTGENIDDSLPFKIYICIPRASLYFLRGEEEKYVQEDGTVDVLSGKLSAATYSDFNLLETTVLQEAEDYIQNKLAADLSKFRDGTLKEEQKKRDEESNQAKWIDTKKMKNIDIETLKAILRMKTFVGVQDDTAADFLDNMPEKNKTGGRKYKLEDF